jgi:protease PrsW
VAYVFLFFVVLAYLLVIVACLAFERRTIQSELRDEVGTTITPQEYAILPTYFRRTGYYLRLALSGQLLTCAHARRLHSAAVDLALAKRLARRFRTPVRTERVRALRRKISNLRAGAALPTTP